MDEADTSLALLAMLGAGHTENTGKYCESITRGIEFLVFYGFVPDYDFAHHSIRFSGIKVDQDYKAWYDLCRRLNHMFGMAIDLADLEEQSEKIIASVESEIDELEKALPELQVRRYIQDVTASFEERPFMPLGDLWERELGDLFQDLDD